MTTVVVTGAAGFVGRHLVGTLEQAGHDIIAVRGRWRDRADLRSQLAGWTIDTTVHLGWYAGAADYRTNEEENERSYVAGTELADALLDLCDRPHLVVAGTWADKEPADAYGRWKRMLHEHLTEAARRRGLRLAWARLHNVVGPGEAASRFGPSIASAVAAGRRFEVTSGTQLRDYVDVTDVARALGVLACSAAVGDYDVGTGVATPVATFARAVARAAGDEALLTVAARPASADEVGVAVADPTPLIALGWRPRHDLEGIAERVASASVER